LEKKEKGLELKRLAGTSPQHKKSRRSQEKTANKTRKKVNENLLPKGVDNTLTECSKKTWAGRRKKNREEIEREAKR